MNIPRIEHTPARVPSVAQQPLECAPLVGRNRDVVIISDWLCCDDIRLLTLIGPPGAGKSCLGRAAAAVVRGRFDDILWIDMTAAQNAEQLLAAVAERLAFKAQGELVPIEHIARQAGDQRLLLALDNMEHLVKEAPLLVELLNACPHMCMLLTSRVALRVRGERVYLVEPLAVPALTIADRHPLSYAPLMQYPAVELFLLRAQSIGSSYVLPQALAPLAAELCRLLDGLPLAIELAAARLRWFSPQTLLARLVGRDGNLLLQALSGGPRDLHPHQRSLTATFDRSYGLLSPAEQTLLQRLAILADGWTLEAAESICADTSGEQSASALPLAAPDGSLFGLVEALLDKSLLRAVNGPNGEPRFAMLQTIRTYARERLANSGAVEMLRRQHAAFYLGLAEQAAVGMDGEIGLGVCAQLAAEGENLQAALRWATQQNDRPAIAQLGRALWHLSLTDSHANGPQSPASPLASEPGSTREQGDQRRPRRMARTDELTPRELAVLRELAKGHSNAAIAERLQIAKRTVDAHLYALYGKLGVRSRGAAIRYAVMKRLV